jgi:hypothetical protein
MVGCTGKSADSRIPESARAALENADQFELLSIDPDRQQDKTKDDFHGWKVLGKTQIKETDTRTKLVAALKKGGGRMMTQSPPASTPDTAFARPTRARPWIS